MKVVQEWLKSRSLMIKDGVGRGTERKETGKSRHRKREEPASGWEEAEGVTKSAP